jgi:ribosomal protein L35
MQIAKKKVLLYLNKKGFLKRFTMTSTKVLKARSIRRRHNLISKTSNSKRLGHKNSYIKI